MLPGGIGKRKISGAISVPATALFLLIRSVFCGVRKHVSTQGLESLAYGKPLALGVDPVEKKPLYHYFPGSSVLSLGTRGCTMHCPYCQNHRLVSAPLPSREEREHSPQEMVAAGVEQGISLLAFTYNEPTVWYEYLRDCLELWNQQEDCSGILVTNGQMTEKPLRELTPLLGACNVDVKSFNEEQYENLLGGSLTQAKRFVEILVEQGVHVEITWLVVPGINTEKSSFHSCMRWIASLSPFIPLHITRAFPAHNWNGFPPSLEPSSATTPGSPGRSCLRIPWKHRIPGINGMS